MKYYCLLDIKANCFLLPFPARTNADAVRQMQIMLQRDDLKENTIVRFPEDYELHYCFDFDETNGGISTVIEHARVEDIFLPEFIMRLDSLKSNLQN